MKTNRIRVVLFIIITWTRELIKTEKRTAIYWKYAAVLLYQLFGCFVCFSGKSEQLNEIRRIKLSRLICDNGDRIETAQVYVMVLPDPDM